MPSSGTLLVASILGAGLAYLPPRIVAAQAPKPDLSEKALVAAAANYVAAYEKDFAFLIADETYRQTRYGADNQTLQRRLLKSEMFLTYLPADREWVAVRDVLEVDGAPVTDREDLPKLLSRREELRGLIRDVIARNARYNIGSTTRNFNEPTLPLLLLDARRIGGVNFDRRKVSVEDGTTLVTLAFSERDRPTLVRGPAGSVAARGEILIEAATGIVRRTTFELDRPGVDVKLVTTYEKDRKLNLWLPALFTERYETSAGSRYRELVVCEAKYSNYRRFEVTARIK